VATIRIENGRVKIDSLRIVLFTEEDGEGLTYITYAPQLKAYGYGATAAEAFEGLAFYIQAYIENLLQDNAIEEELRQLGWASIKENGPSFVAHMDEAVIPDDIPPDHGEAKLLTRQLEVAV